MSIGIHEHGCVGFMGGCSCGLDQLRADAFRFREISAPDFKRTCFDCQFYKKAEYQPGDGECRRHAPTIQLMGGSYFGEWPRMGPSSWCGEFKPSDGSSIGVKPIS